MPGKIDPGRNGSRAELADPMEYSSQAIRLTQDWVFGTFDSIVRTSPKGVKSTLHPLAPNDTFSHMFPRSIHEGSIPMRGLWRVAALLVSGTQLAACSTLVGNVTPVDEKSEVYRTLNLEKEDSTTWRKLPPDPRLKSDVESSDASDVVFQTRDESAVISLNSACREIPATESKIPAVVSELTLGFTATKDVEEKWIDLNGHRAYRKTLTGTLEGRRTRLRIVILAAGNCLYDFSYISSPELFSAREADFDRFVKSLNVKK